MNRAVASPELCAFVREQAPPHYATPDAPSNWLELKAWYENWQDRAKYFGDCFVLPVWDGGCEKTIYPDARTNHAFRAWHDSIHFANDYSFSREDEIKIGLIHMQQVRKAGLPKSDQDTIVADTIGQIEYFYKYDAFIDNQAEFVGDVLATSLRAVLDTGVRY